MIVSGRSKPAIDGHLKTSHFEETQISQVGCEDNVACPGSPTMANLLKMAISETIRTLHRRGWSQRRIADELGINRETVARHLRLAEPPPKPANAPTGSEPVGDSSKPANAPSARRTQERHASPGRRRASQPGA